MKPRRILVAGLFVVTPLVVVVACSFPDVAFESASGLEAGTRSEAGYEGARDSGGSDALPDGLAPVDAAVRDDATVRVDASSCVATCDCDDDGYLKDGCDAGEDAAGMLPGDCDDLDPRRNPGSTFRKDVPVGHDGDWNCDKHVDKSYSENSKCSGTVVTGCSGETFKGAVACGRVAEYYKCGPNGISCAPVSFIDQRTQQCK